MAVSKKARAGKLTAADMQGGCFTISSLGGLGGTAFTPIVNAPEVGILGVSKSEMKTSMERQGLRTSPNASSVTILRSPCDRWC